MAIIDTQPTRSDVLQQADAGPYLRRPLFPAIRWSAVLAGVAVGISVQLVLTLLGIATGLSAAQVGADGAMGMGALIWAALSMLIGAFVGGYVAARLSGLKRRSDGVLHGAVSWAVTTILFTVLATSIGGMLVSGVFSNLAQLAGTTATASGASPIGAFMRSQGVNVDADTLRQLQQHLQAGQREPAVQLVRNATGFAQTRAEAIVDQALILTGSPEAASSEGRQAAEGAMQTAGTAAWGLFLPLALALAIGIIGGVLGVKGSRRVDWTGTPPPVIRREAGAAGEQPAH